MCAMKRFHRSERVSEELLREISNIIHTEMKDPRISGMISLTRVETSKDLRHATVFVSVYGDDKSKPGTMEALRHGAGFIRSLVGKRMRIRMSPEIDFRLDDSIERGSRISSILREVLPENDGAEKEETEKD